MSELIFKEAKVLVVGDSMLDRYWFGDVNRISPEAPVPVVRVTHQEERLGGAANVALNIASIGATPALLSVVGKDEAGQKLELLARRAGIRPEFDIDTDISTTVKLRIIGRQQQMVRCDFEATPHQDSLNRLLSNFEAVIADYQILVLSDYGKGVLSHIRQMIQTAQTHGIPVLIDPKGSDYDRYQGATIITPNRSELQQVVGSWNNEQDLQNKAQALRERLKLKYLLLTRSEEGMTLYSDQGSLSVAAQAREVYDVSGAGDTAIAVLATMLAKGFDIETSVNTANRAAGIVVGKLGTAAINYEELFPKQVLTDSAKH